MRMMPFREKRHRSTTGTLVRLDRSPLEWPHEGER
jgi:hypothetical protein